jgi:hypothetical protein
MHACRRVLPSIAVAAMLALLPATSIAGSGYSTKIVVSLKVPAFHGTLRSDKGACATSRMVTLYRERSGPDKLLGTDRSNAKAEWSIPIGKPTSGSYYAKASAKGRCKPARSKVISLG